MTTTQTKARTKTRSRVRRDEAAQPAASAAEASPRPLVNGVDVAGLQATVQAVQADPALGKSHFRAANHWLGGAKNRSEIGGFYAAGEERRHVRTFVFDADEPAVLLGKDEGANPVEFILHGLAACATTSTVYHAAARNIRIRKIETRIEGDIDLQGFLGLSKQVRPGFQTIRINMKIDSDATVEEKRELERLYRFSPVVDTVMNAVDLKVNVNAR